MQNEIQNPTTEGISYHKVENGKSRSYKYGKLHPGCYRGHDEESRNGRDVKIDVLDDYIRTSERFRVIRVFLGVPESYGNTYWALLGHTGKKEKGLKGGRTPPLGLVRIGLGKGGAPFLPSLFPFLFSYSIWEVESY